MLFPVTAALLLACAPKVADLAPPPNDTPPVLLRVGDTVKVPMSARRDGIEGTWTVLVTVDEEGDVVAARMEGHAREDVAETCIKHWKKSSWQPAWRDGEWVQWDDIRVHCNLSIK